MKREDLEKLGITDKEQVDAIMTLHGKGVEAHKTAAESAQAELKTSQDQLSKANETIEGFKKLDVDGIKQAADEWKSKFETAQNEAAEQMSKMKFDHALDGALAAAKPKDQTATKAVKALLDHEGLKLQADGSILGLNEQLEKIKSEADYLFESDGNDPKIVANANNTGVLQNADSFMAAARRGAQLPDNSGAK